VVPRHTFFVDKKERKKERKYRDRQVNMGEDNYVIIVGIFGLGVTIELN
jgi:hypothetical protein